MEFVNRDNPKLAGFESEYAKKMELTFKPEDYMFKGQDKVITPALLFYEDIIRENTALLVREAKGPERLLPHMKTHKTAEILNISREYGLKNVMCATIPECEVAARCGLERVFLTYPLIGPNPERFFAMSKAFPKCDFTFLCDDLTQLERADEIAGEMGAKCSFLVDVNPGLDRTGIMPDELEAFSEKASKAKNLVMRGIHFYDCNDRALDPEEFKAAIFAQDKMIVKKYEAMKKLYPSVDTLVVGGTPEMEYHVEYPYDDMYYSPGTVFLYDWTYVSNFPSMPYKPAAFIMTRVMSHPKKGYFTLDLGTKGLSQDTPATNGLLVGIHNCKAIAQNEEHWIFKMDEGHEDERPEVGTEVFVLPAHICPNMMFYPKALVIRDKEIKDSWDIAARDRKITF